MTQNKTKLMHELTSPSSKKLAADKYNLHLPFISHKNIQPPLINKNELINELKLPFIKQKQKRADLNNEKDEFRANKSEIAPKSAFEINIEEKMRNVLAIFDDESSRADSYNSDDFDFEFKIKKNMEDIQKRKHTELENPKTENSIEKNKEHKEPLQPKERNFRIKPNKPKNTKPIQIELPVNKEVEAERPKSSRDTTNDNKVIKKRNETIAQKRPKTSRIIQLNDIEEIKQKKLENLEKLEHDSKAAKSEFQESMEEKMKKVMENIHDKADNCERKSYASDDFDFEYKIKVNKEKIHKERFEKMQEEVQNEQLKAKTAPKINFLEPIVDPTNRPKSSKDISNDNSSINSRNITLISKRPRSSKHINAPENEQKGQKSLQRKNLNDILGQREKEKIIGKSKTEKEEDEKKIDNKIKSNKLITEMKSNEIEKLKKSSKLILIPKSPKGDLKLALSGPKVNFKIEEQPTSIKKISRSIKLRGQSEKKLPLKEKDNLNRQNNRQETLPLISKEILKSSEPEKEVQRKRNSSWFKPHAIIDDVLEAREERSHRNIIEPTIEDLKKAKKELEEKMKRIDIEMNEISDSAHNGKEEHRLKMKFSARDWKKIDIINGQEIECEISSFDKELDKINKLQQKSDNDFETYLQNRIFLTNLKHHKKEG